MGIGYATRIGLSCKDAFGRTCANAAKGNKKSSNP